jgi:FixJ family two-component response regulator
MTTSASAPVIAILDDDPSVLKALARLLNARSFRPQTYASVDAFLASLPVGLPDCLILDVQMPGMTGIELQHHLARLGIHVPTIIMTAHSGPGLRERCTSAGAAAFLMKPLREESLLAAITLATDPAARRAQ